MIEIKQMTSDQEYSIYSKSVEEKTGFIEKLLEVNNINKEDVLIKFKYNKSFYILSYKKDLDCWDNRPGDTEWSWGDYSYGYDRFFIDTLESMDFESYRNVHISEFSILDNNYNILYNSLEKNKGNAVYYIYNSYDKDDLINIIIQII